MLWDEERHSLWGKKEMREKEEEEKRNGQARKKLTVGIEVTFSAQYSSTALILFRVMEKSVRTLADADHHPQTGLGLRSGSRRGCGMGGGWR